MNSLTRLHSTRLISGHGLYNVATRQRAFSSHKVGSLSVLHNFLKVSDEVKNAIATNKPVVALESTIYTHGALGDLGLEDIVRRNGAVPAVCGILAGVPTVGLLPQEVDRMVNEKARKISRKDIANITGKGLMGIREHGGTTISGTMVLARLAGIKIFGTGGLGGVHRDGENSMDISADLTELGRTSMAVVASGCKGFLDIARTLEFLETHGVNVATFLRGRPADQVNFPGFWATDSGLKSPCTVSNEEEAAAMILVQESMGIESGIVFANPIPEKDSIPRSEMDAIIEQAIAESTRQGVSGNENTPFILKRIKELSGGRSVTSNTSLVRANVECAAKIAVALSDMSGRLLDVNHASPGPRSIQSLISNAPALSRPQVLSQVEILVAGSVAVDLNCDYVSDSASDPNPRPCTSNPAVVTQSVGGVGRNVALAAHSVSLGSGVRFCSIIGDDPAGSSVISSLKSFGMDVSCIQILDKTSDPTARTAEYIAVNTSDKNLFLAMADMRIFSSDAFADKWDHVVAQSGPKWLVVDANWSASGVTSWIKAGERSAVKVAFEPVSQVKSAKLFPLCENRSALGVFPNQNLHLSTPNQYELASLHHAATVNDYFNDSEWRDVYDSFDHSQVNNRLSALANQYSLDIASLQQAIKLLPYIPMLVTKLGSRGAVLTQILSKNDPRLSDPAAMPYIVESSSLSSNNVGGIYIRAYPALKEVDDVVSVNGAGDTFLGVLVSGLASGGKIEHLINVAQQGAIMTLRSTESVSPTLGDLKNDILAAAISGTDTI